MVSAEYMKHTKVSIVTMSTDERTYGAGLPQPRPQAPSLARLRVGNVVQRPLPVHGDAVVIVIVQHFRHHPRQRPDRRRRGIVPQELFPVPLLQRGARLGEVAVLGMGASGVVALGVQGNHPVADPQLDVAWEVQSRAGVAESKLFGELLPSSTMGITECLLHARPERRVSRLDNAEAEVVRGGRE